MPIKINGATSGSTTITAPDSGSDESIELSTALASKGDYTDWTSYTPTWTNLTVGNGTVVAKYSQIGKIVSVYIAVTFGSTTSVSGNITYTLPVTGASGGPYVGNGVMTDTGNISYPAYVSTASTTTGQIRVINTASTFARISSATSTEPFTWGTGDVFNLFLTYEAA